MHASACFPRWTTARTEDTVGLKWGLKWPKIPLGTLRAIINSFRFQMSRIKWIQSSLLLQLFNPGHRSLPDFFQNSAEPKHLYPPNPHALLADICEAHTLQLLKASWPLEVPTKSATSVCNYQPPGHGSHSKRVWDVAKQQQSGTFQWIS